MDVQTSGAEGSKRELVTPETLKGFQDLLPEDMIARNAVVEKIKRVYEKYGFLPLDTPVLEYLVTLIGTGGEETNKQLFRLESPEREPIAMRFDLTVPFARLVAQYPEKLKLPFRRYHIGPVFRADKPGPGRFRQFTQFDIDSAGSESVAVDAEIVAAMCEVMKEVGLCNRGEGDGALREYLVRINDRKLVDALLENVPLPNKESHNHVLRVLDKLEKVGLDNVRKELGEGRVDESGDPIRGVKLASPVIEKILAFISVRGHGRADTIERLAEHLSPSKLSSTALQEMRDLAAALESLEVQECDAVFDPSLVRGLDYYTGAVYEGVLLGAAGIGSVMGGGRYDKLVERFLPEEKRIPATGASIGLDRFITGLRQLGKVQTVSTTVKVLVISTPGIPATELLSAASQLRREGISAQPYLGNAGASMREQLAFANSNGIPIAAIIGEDELKSNTISVKDLRIGRDTRANIRDRDEYRKAGKAGQITVDRRGLAQAVCTMLEAD